MKRFRLTRARQLTLISTILMSFAIIVFYIIMLAEISTFFREHDITQQVSFTNAQHVIFLVAFVSFAYLISSIVVDNALNPIRVMISKVKEIGKMNFKEPLEVFLYEDELLEFAIAFNTMSRNLNSYIERQKQFISDATHELATPITAINGHADLLLRRGKETPSLLDSSLTIIKDEVLRMNNLVDSLLLLARNDSGKETYIFEKTNISTLINNSIEEMQIIAPDFDFIFEVDDNDSKKLFARCDEYSIRRVMRIILSNAVKYSCESNFLANKKVVHIQVTQGYGMITVTVKDYGIGIPQEHLSRIFERFYRVDPSRSKKTGSSGLGLAIAKEIITAHNGQIYAKSSESSSNNNDDDDNNNGTEISFVISS